MFIRTGTLVLFALLIAPVIAFAEPDKPPVPSRTDSERLETMQKLLERIRDDMTMLRVKQDNAEKDVELLRQRVNELHQAVQRLDRVATSSRSASYFTPEGTPPAGMIRLLNRTGVTTSVIVNNRSYTVPPLESVVIQAQPAGAFNYEVVAEGYGSIRGPTTRVLGAGETFSIVINP